MDFPPINIFSQSRDPESILSRLLERVPDAKVRRHADGTWAEAQMTFKRGWLKKPLTMKANHDPHYYSGPGWQQQLAGMHGYFSSFSNTTERADLFRYLPTLGFSFNFMFDGEPGDDDPRLKVVFEMARETDGVIFLPGRLLDSSGRVILAADGNNDPEAQLPDHASTDDNDDDGTFPPAPPTEDRVFRRFLLTCSLVQRGFMEGSVEAEEYRQKMVLRLKNNGVWDEAEDWEAEALETPVDSLPEKLKWKLPWLSEGAIILGWSLGLVELPAYDQEVYVDGLYEIAHEAENGQRKACLQPLAEIEKLSFQLLAIHWRLRQFSLDHKAMDFVAFAPTAWCGPMDLSLTRLINNDLELQGIPIVESPPESLQRAGGIMEERRKTLYWVLGQHPVHSQNDTST